MASSVTVASPRPNNCELLVLRQLVDPEGGNVGPATVEAVLDDGQSVTVAAEPNVVVVVVEHPRGAPVVRYAVCAYPITETVQAPPALLLPDAPDEPDEGQSIEAA